MRAFLRIALLLLIAVLLPLRGAMAQTMSCAPAMVPAAMHEQQGEHAEDMADMHHVDSQSGAGDRHAADPQKCSLCAVSCGAVPLAWAGSPRWLAAGAASVVYPALSAAAPRHLSEGLERPPRRS